MNHVGTKTIETKRLLLRKFKSSDAEDMYRNWASDAEVTKFLTWPTYKNIDTAKYMCSLWEEEALDAKNYQWCIELKSINEAIGSISVTNINENISSVEIGYCIGKKFWNKQIVTEAFSGVIKLLFDEVKVNRITARHDTKNPASGKVMSKCGLKFEGIMREADRNNTGICDMAVYGIVKEDYLKEEEEKNDFKIVPISNTNRELVNKFIKSNWYSTYMVIHGEIFDMTLLDGFVVYKNEEIAGLITYFISNNECEIISLDSLIENKGIGTRLIDEVVKVSKNKGCKKLKLITTNDNINAIKFYQKYGFDINCIYKNAVNISRKLKSSIPEIGNCGIRIKHEIEFLLDL